MGKNYKTIFLFFPRPLTLDRSYFPLKNVFMPKKPPLSFLDTTQRTVRERSRDIKARNSVDDEAGGVHNCSLLLSRHMSMALSGTVHKALSGKAVAVTQSILHSVSAPSRTLLAEGNHGFGGKVGFW